MLRAPFVLIWNLVKLVFYILKVGLFRLAQFVTRKQTKWVRLKIPRRLAFGPPAGLAAHFQDKPTYVDLRDQIEVLADDPYIEGVIITADQLSMGPARTADLRSLVERLRTSGKSTIVHLHSVHGSEYDLACAADDVVMTPGGRFYMFGHRFEQFFAGPLLERLGIAPQFVHIGPFKTAAHRFVHSQPSEPLKLMMNQLVDGLSDQREAHIREYRNVDEDQLTDSFEDMPIDARTALATGLIDGRIHRRFLARWIDEGPELVDSPPLADVDLEGEDGETEAFERPVSLNSPESNEAASENARAQSTLRDGEDGEDGEDERLDVRIKDAESYVDAKPDYQWTPLLRRRRTIAAIDLTGMIVMPGMELPGHSLATIDPNDVLPILRSLTSDSSVGAVVLHINSPGGSALASEMLWDGIRRLRYEKPTLAYCSNVAASGGYYMACGADRIICQPETITGSIGVIAGKFSLPGTFDKLDVGTESFHRYDTSAFQSVSQPLSESAMENLRRDARSFYRQFLRRVGEARQLSRRRLHRYARGRIYTGADAHRRVLVDHLGGFDDAVEIARSLSEPKLSESAPLRFCSHRTIGLPALLKQSTTASIPFRDTFANCEALHRLTRRDPMLALMPYRLANSTPAT